MKLGIVTDIHEDYESLKRAFSIIEKHNCDDVISLGDISGFSVPYYPYLNTRNAKKCLTLLKANCKEILLGNHDLFAMRKVPQFDVGFEYPENWYDLDYHQRKNIGDGDVWLYENNELNPLYSKEDLEYLRSLPEYFILEDDDRKILFSHYLFPNLSGSQTIFYTNPKDILEHFNFMETKDCDYSICGHVHIDGITLMTQKKDIKKSFKKVEVPKEKTVILSPAIARGSGRSGFLIFDTKKLIVEAIKI